MIAVSLQWSKYLGQGRASSVCQILLLCLALLCAPVVYANGLTLHATDSNPSLAGHLSMLVDHSGQLGFAQVSTRASQRGGDASVGEFVAVSGNEVNVGFMPHGALWVHFTLARETDTPALWWLNTPQDTLDTIDVYIEQTDGTYAIRHGGRALPFAQRELYWHGHAFALTLDGTDARHVFMRFASLGPLRPPLELWQPKAFEQHRTMENFGFGMFFGVMLLAFVLGLYRTIRYRLNFDFVYVVYIGSLELSNLAAQGYLQQYFHLDHSIAIIAIQYVGMILAGNALFWFVAILIDWPITLKHHMIKIVTGMTSLWLLALVLLLIKYPYAAPKWNMIISLMSGIVSVTISFWAATRGWKGGRTLVLAFSPFVLGALLYMAGAFGVLQGTWFLRNFYFVASAFHVAILHAYIIGRGYELQAVNDRLKYEMSSLSTHIKQSSLFLRMLTHEVRTPLAIIDNTSQLMAMQNNTGMDHAHNIRTIRTASHRVAELLDRCLTQDRFAEIQVVNRKPVDLKALISMVVAEMQRRTDHHILTCHIGELPATFSADQVLCQIMLANLLENAISYSPEGGSITISAHSAANNHVVIEVADEGVGIPADALEEIFERYFRTQQVTGAVGAGLGLYIVRSIARLHGGDVTCQSTLGEGSTFFVTLVPMTGGNSG